MDEQIIAAYLNLIQELLTCSNGEEVITILNRSSDLIDEEFVQVCEQVAEMLRGQGQDNQASFLNDLAEQLAKYLNMVRDGGERAENSSNSLDDYENFLQQLIQIEIDSNSNPKIVYPFLAQHQNKLDLQFAEIITQWFYSIIDLNNSELSHYSASLINSIAVNIAEFPFGQLINNIEIAITCYQNALTVHKPDTFPQDWAGTQNNLAAAYSKRIKGSRADNLEKAITCLQDTLNITTKDSFPQDWARTQNNLGNAYRNRIKGSRADNLEYAIACYTSALNITTKDSFPQDWARTQNNLGNAYRNRIKGLRTDNLEYAIACYTSALNIYTKDSFPYEWATTQNNLGNAYSNRIKGYKDDNLKCAITCYKNALTITTKDSFPQDWARTQNNLGLAHKDREKKAKTNLEKAINCFTNALKVYSKDAFPYEWATTQNNLGNAYLYRRKGKTNNLEKAITYFTNALKVYTKETFPQNNTETLYNLGLTYQKQSNYYSNNPAKKQIALENAFNTFKEALDVFEYIRGDITDNEAKTKLNEEWNKLYQGMVEVCLELDKYNTAIEYVDCSKARNLVELIAFRNEYPEDVLPIIRQRLQELRHCIAGEEWRLQQDPNLDYKYINQLRQEYQDKFPYKPLSLDEIQKLLDEKNTILEWYILPGDKRKLLTFIITANNLKLQIFTKEDLDQLIDFGNEYLITYRFNKDQWQNYLSERMQKLSNILHLPQLLESVFTELPQCKKLILIPHLFLHLFPIHALPVMHNGENKPLQEYFAQGVSYAPNCQLLQQAQKRQYSQFDRLFAIQNPTNDLTWADLEVESIKEMFHPNKHDSLEKQNATKTNFLNKDLSQVNHLYFSCHGSSNIIEPLKSGLLLADTVLTLEEIISKLKLSQCSLVTLSACETGQVGIDQTDEYISLASGFILAGASNIVSTLWSVNQVSAAILMIHFYETLLADEQKSVAVAVQASQKWLREATTQDLFDWADQCTVISRERRQEINYALGWYASDITPYSSPYHWAAFCAIGQ